MKAVIKILNTEGELVHLSTCASEYTDNQFIGFTSPFWYTTHKNHKIILEVDGEEVPSLFIPKPLKDAEGYIRYMVRPKKYLVPFTIFMQSVNLTTHEYESYANLLSASLNNGLLTDKVFPEILITDHSYSLGLIILYPLDKGGFNVHRTISDGFLGFVKTVEHLANIIEANDLPQVSIKY